MHRAIASNTAPQARRFASRAMLKRPVNASPRKTPAFSSLRADQNSTLALDTLSRLRATTGERLSWSQIRAVLLSAAVPMVGFGFMDNFVMIQAGSYIDSTLGVQFGLTTMTAAAMGQVVSDVSGVLFGGTLDRMMSPWVKPANLTAAQQRLALVPRLRLAGAVVGVIVGCCLGASSLLFVPGDESQKDQLLQLQGILHDMLSYEEMKGASCVMHVKNVSHRLVHEHVAVVGLSKDHSLATQCAERRELIGDGNIVYIPILCKDDTVAVLEVQRENGFSVENTEDSQRMARHVGIFMDRIWTE